MMVRASARPLRRSAARWAWVVLPLLMLAMFVAGALNVPRVRAYALSQHSLGAHGSVEGYNLVFAWTDHFGGDGFRAVMYPLYVNERPSRTLFWRPKHREPPENQVE
jgi:hypothetical protein